MLTTGPNVNESRLSSTWSKNSQESRLQYFGALQKRERPALGETGSGYEDALDKLNAKLDSYLKNNYSRIDNSAII